MCVRRTELHRWHSLPYHACMDDASTLSTLWATIAERHRGELDRFGRITVGARCAKCRERDWRAGGPGRADLLAEVVAYPDERILLATRRERLSAVATAGLHDGGVDRLGRPVSKLDGASRAAAEVELGADEEPFDGARFRCRRGTRLRADERDVLLQLARLEPLAPSLSLRSVYIGPA